MPPRLSARLPFSQTATNQTNFARTHWPYSRGEKEHALVTSPGRLDGFAPRAVSPPRRREGKREAKQRERTWGSGPEGTASLAPWSRWRLRSDESESVLLQGRVSPPLHRSSSWLLRLGGESPTPSCSAPASPRRQAAEREREGGRESTARLSHASSAPAAAGSVVVPPVSH